ncbi:MAG: hypothetical protein Q8N48_02940, partial [Thiobacillus sp.]|nr:hypothetical protein [Thiobacillus sp.]MDP2977766.1 hypothetical protein [Thiobacillus sp.]
LTSGYAALGDQLDRFNLEFPAELPSCNHESPPISHLNKVSLKSAAAHWVGLAVMVGAVVAGFATVRKFFVPPQAALL